MVPPLTFLYANTPELASGNVWQRWRNKRAIWHATCCNGDEEGSYMRLLFGILILAVCVHAQTDKTHKAAKESLTGCIDERQGQYVLTNDVNLQVISRLQPAAGSAEDNFARYLGHKVTVRGKLSRESSPPTMTVENLASISDSCAPNPGTH